MLPNVSSDPVIRVLPAETGCAGHLAYRRVSACVMQDFGVIADEMAAPSRGSPRTALARQVAMYLCHVGFSMSFEAIGRQFGRDRTTVAHACRVVEDRRDDIWFDCRIAALELALNGKTMSEAERGQ
ncbi:MAG TPA: helix-turn-helix domain-containing protein [Afipia sp.]